MIANILNHRNTQKNKFPNFCQTTTTAYLNDISMVNFMQKHGTNVSNTVMSSNNDFLFDIDPDTQLAVTH